MTRAEREELKKLARERARVAKADAARRTSDLKADFERQVVTHYEYDRDEIWKAAVEAATEAVERAQHEIADRCEQLGIPRELAPTLQFGWVGRGPYAVKNEQQGLRRAAYAQIDAMERTAKHEVDRKALEIQTQLVAAGLTSERAVEFLGSMPAVDDLMPPLDLLALTGGNGVPDDDGIGF